MKKVLFLIFASLFVLGACGQDSDKSNKDDNNKSESKSVKKSNDPKKDKKSDDKKVDSKDEKQSESKNNSDDTTNNESESTSKNDNGNNERTQGKQATQQQSNNQQAQNNNGYMSQAEIDEWNRTKPTTHDESQMGYGRSEYEQARKASEKVWDNPNAHVGGPSWVGKNEGYDSWANRQKEVAEMQSE